MNRLLSLQVLLLSFLLVPSLHAQYLIESEFLSNTPSYLLGVIPTIPAVYDVDYYRITYNTTDTHGEPTVASGALAIPVTENCNSFPMAVYCHGTVLRQYDVPSYENFEGLVAKLFASTGYIAVAPDYLGLGDGEGIHPYVHAESEATASIDLIRAAREFLENGTATDNGEVFVTGYSQGGQGAMATLKYAEENGLTDELGIKAGAPCSGPYNLSGSQASVLLSDQPYSNPGYVIYLLMSYELAYGNLYTNISDVIQQPYADEIEPYFDGQQNQYDMGAVNSILPDQLSDLLVDTTFSNFQTNPNHPLWQDLEANDTYNWLPQVPVRLYYCSGDEQVDYHNSTTADSAMNALGAADVHSFNVQPGGSHGDCVIPALTQAFYFFDSLATPCVATAVLRAEKLHPLDLYPNPATDHITLDIPGGRGYAVILDMYGRIVDERKITAQETPLNISHLATGTYIVSVKAGQLVYRTTLVVN